MDNSQTVKVLHEDIFDAFIEQEGVAVVVFGASWCQPCIAFEKMIEDLSTVRTDVHFGHVDVEGEPALQKDFEVRSVPTVILFRKQIALCKESGEMTAEVINDLIDQALTLDMAQVEEEIARKLVDEQ